MLSNSVGIILAILATGGINFQFTDNGGLVNVTVDPIHALAGQNTNVNFHFKDGQGNLATVDYTLNVHLLQVGSVDQDINAINVQGQSTSIVNFPKTGDYILTITITKFNGMDIAPESAQFEVLVTESIPEFPLMAEGVIFASITTSIIIGRLKKW